MKHILFFGVLLVACGELSQPDRPDPNEFISNPNDPGDNDPGIGVGIGEAPAQPTLAPMPDRTGWLTVPVRGETDSSAAVVVTGGVASTFTDASTSGQFCVDVELFPGATHSLEVFAQNGRGLTSARTLLSITHDPVLSPVPVDPPLPVEILENIVELGVTMVYASEPAYEGALASVVDIDPSTVLVARPGRLSLDLGRLVALEAIEIEFADIAGTGNDEYAEVYEVLISADDDPAAWETVAEVSGPADGVGEGGVDRFELDPGRDARWIAFDLVRNAKGFDFSERITIATVRAEALMLVQPDSDPPPTAPTCATP